MPSPADDVHRVEVLRSYGVLDTAPEGAFDRLTQLLAVLCEAPLALVSLVDSHRQWFKSVYGARWQETDRAIAFCNHTIAQPGILMVEDATQDPRFAGNALVFGEEGIRFYAGMPLRTADGVALGALSVLDRVPRRLTAVQALALETLAEQVMTQLEARRRQHSLEQALLQRERSQTALRESESRWRLLFERNPLPMWVYDVQTLRFLAVNDAAVVHYGWSPAEFLAMTLRDIRPPEDLPALMHELGELRNGLNGGQRWRHRKKNGQLIQADITAHSVPFDGRAARLVLANDVTERVQAEQALRASQARWERLFAASATGIASASLTGELTSANPAFCALLGRSEAALLGTHMFACTHPEDVANCQQALFSLLAGEQDSFSIEKRYLRPDGRAVWARAAVTLTSAGDAEAGGGGGGDGRHFVAVVQDIDAQHAAEEALRQSHELVALAGRLARLGGWAVRLPAAVGGQPEVHWTDELVALLDCPPGYRPDMEETLAWHPPGSRERAQQALQACLAHGTPFDIDLEILTPAGRTLALRGIGQATRDSSGRIVGAQGALHDLSDRRRAEQRLRQQAELLDAAHDAITVTDLQRRVTYWNRGAELMFGWPREETLGRPMSELLLEDPAEAEAVLAEVLARGEWTATQRQQHRAGHQVVVDARWTLLRDAEDQPSAVLAIKTDVTQRLGLQAQLQQSQRLEAVGQLTGGVAHDFNNLLTVILGNADLLAEQLADQPHLLALAEMTRSAAERGAELTQRLLAFARRQALQPQAVDAHALLAGMDALLRRTLPASIELELVRAAGLWPALTDPGQLESALLNLVLNARDAMPEGGKITLETANAWIDQDYAEGHADVLPGQYVMLSVSDTGTGMSAAHLARVFEPFFTTKPVGQGSGLGLSMVYGFVKQSRGHVKLYSEPGHGTTVRLYLPRTGSAVAALAPGRRAGPDLRGTALVLVVEDDPLVRRHATELLAGLGYRVLAADHGAAALAVLHERADIELLFTDVVMPGGMNGRQLAEAALALRPGLKVLYTSGYTENAIVHHGRLDRGVHLLPKPYRSIDLARKVHGVLAGLKGSLE